MSSQVLLRVEDISASYGRKEIIHNCSIELGINKLIGLIGPNGCGKTTLIRCIAGRIPHDGSCYLNNTKLEDLTVKKLAQEISYIPQKSGIEISIPAIEVVMMGFNPYLKLLETPSEKMKKMAENALELVGIGEFCTQDFQTLSEGQKQLVFIARTIIEDTGIMLLDEPDSALDLRNRHEVLKKLRETIKNGEKTGLICLHDPVLALEYCDEIVLMKDGKIEQIIYPKEDSLLEMEKGFSKIYGDIKLIEFQDSKRKNHLTIVWEG